MNNLIEVYMGAMRPFNQPYFAMLDVYAGFLRQLPQFIAPALAKAPPSSEMILPRRAIASATARDATKKELATAVEPVSPKRPGKTPALAHSAAVERAKRAWATRRANVAADEKAARKAARAKARARKMR